MNGHVDKDLRSLVSIEVSHPTKPVSIQAVAWVDSGFTGSLMLPAKNVAELQLTPVLNTTHVGLADGSVKCLSSCKCHIDWFGEKKLIQVVESNVQTPFIGAELMRNHTLTINYPASTVTIQ